MHCKRIREAIGKRGVTLTELLVVIVIIAIFASIALPSLTRAMSRAELSRRTDFLAGVISTCRVKAMEQGIYWRLKFDITSGTFEAFGDNNSNGDYDSGEERLGPYHLEDKLSFGCIASSGPNNTAMPDDGVSFNDNTLSFNNIGSCNAGTAYLKSDDRSSAVRVMSSSGTVLCWIYDGVWRSR